MIQWLQLSDEANGGEFLELERGFNIAWHNTIGRISQKGEHTESERNTLRRIARTCLRDSSSLKSDFVNAFVEAGSFRYLGKGVRLGDKEKIVCFYKLRDTASIERFTVILELQRSRPTICRFEIYASTTLRRSP